MESRGLSLEGGLLEDAAANHFFMSLQAQGIVLCCVMILFLMVYDCVFIFSPP